MLMLNCFLWQNALNVMNKSLENEAMCNQLHSIGIFLLIDVLSKMHFQNNDAQPVSDSDRSSSSAINMPFIQVTPKPVTDHENITWWVVKKNHDKTSFEQDVIIRQETQSLGRISFWQMKNE